MGWRPKEKEWIKKRNRYFENNQLNKTRQIDYEAGADAMLEILFGVELSGYALNCFLASILEAKCRGGENDSKR